MSISLNSTEASLSTLSYIETLSNVVAAIGTLFIAVFARIYSVAAEQREMIRLNRIMITDAASKVDSNFAFLFFRSRTLNGNNVPSYDIENAFSDDSFVQGTPADIRVAVNNFLESLRTCAHVFHEVLPREKRQMILSLNPQLFIGKYDPATTNLRVGVLEFARFYHWDIDQILELKQVYFKSVLGTDEEWDKLAEMVEIFCPPELWLIKRDEPVAHEKGKLMEMVSIRLPLNSKSDQ
jgi:hypothetical protein